MFNPIPVNMVQSTPFTNVGLEFTLSHKPLIHTYYTDNDIYKYAPYLPVRTAYVALLARGAIYSDDSL